MLIGDGSSLTVRVWSALILGPSFRDFRRYARADYANREVPGVPLCRVALPFSAVAADPARSASHLEQG